MEYYKNIYAEGTIVMKMSDDAFQIYIDDNYEFIYPIDDNTCRCIY